MKNLLTVLCMCLVSLSVWADDLKELEKMLGTEANVKITLGPGVLGMAKMFTKNDDDAQAVLSGLKDLSINVFELNNGVDADDIGDWMSDKVRSLAKNGVEEIVKVVEGDERVHIMAKVNGMVLSDLSIMVFEAGDEFVYIKMNGEIDVAHVNDLTENFNLDIDAFESISLNF